MAALPNRINGEIIWAYMFNDIHAILNNLGNNALEITADYTITDTLYNVFLANASANAVNITLPDATLVDGLKFIIKCTDYSFDVSIQTFGTQTIDLASEHIFQMRNESTTLISAEGNWHEV